MADHKAVCGRRKKGNEQPLKEHVIIARPKPPASDNTQRMQNLSVTVVLKGAAVLLFLAFILNVMALSNFFYQNQSAVLNVLIISASVIEIIKTIWQLRN